LRQETPLRCARASPLDVQPQIGNDWLAQSLANHGARTWQREAKAKRAKTAKTKKAKPAGKTTKQSKTRKPAKTIRTGASGTDPCAAQQQALEDAQLVVDNLDNEINDPDISAAERVRAERQMRAATIRLTAAQTALDRCRGQQP